MNRAGCSRIALLALFVFLGTAALHAQATFSVGTKQATAVASTSAELHGVINPAGAPAAAWFEWGTTTALGNRTDTMTFGPETTVQNFSQTLKNLEPHKTYYFRAVGYHSSATVPAEIGTFTTTDAPAVTSLTATTLAASDITSTSATLNGSVNPGNSTVSVWFNVGTTESLGTRTDMQTLTGIAAVSVTQPFKNLKPNATLYFRIEAYRASDGTGSVGEIKTFNTGAGAPQSPFAVVTNSASAISSASAELRGGISTGGAGCYVWFEWGTTSTSLNQTTPKSISSTTATSDFSFTVTGLQPNTKYYFRAVAQNAQGSVRGDFRDFKTERVASTPPETINEVEHGNIRSGYVVITPDTASAAPMPTVTFGTVSQGSVQSQAGIVPTQMTTDAAMFVEIIPSISRSIGVAIANPGSSDIAVTMTLRDETGVVVGSPVVVPVPSHQQISKFLNDLFGAQTIGSGFRGSVRMQSPVAFAAIGLRFSGPLFSTLPVLVAASSPGVPTRTLVAGAVVNVPQPGTVGGSTALIVPQFAISGGWATQISLVNNTNATISGRLDVFDTQGNPMAVPLNGENKSTFTFSIPAGGTLILAPRDSNGQSPL
jgi:hypothetical protein